MRKGEGDRRGRGGTRGEKSGSGSELKDREEEIGLG